MSRPGSVFIPDLLSAALRPVERALEARSVRVVRQIDRTAPDVIVDRDSLRAVVETLLAEAAAATRDGDRVRVCLKHGPDAIMLSIKDGGPGLGPDERVSVFEDASRPAAPGAPLTLARCRETAAAFGANLFANSQPGKGSTWYLTLPAPRPRPA